MRRRNADRSRGVGAESGVAEIRRDGGARPPDEPPVTCARFHGLCIVPKRVTSALPPYASSCRFVLPSKIAPAAFSRRTTSASSVGTRSRNTSLAAVVRTPAVSMLSFTAIGMPWSGPRGRPACSSFSMARASSSASSSRTVMNACSSGSKRRMRSRQARVRSTGETSPSRSSLEACARVRPASSSVPPAVCADAERERSALHAVKAAPVRKTLRRVHERGSSAASCGAPCGAQSALVWSGSSMVPLAWRRIYAVSQPAL